MKLSLGAIPALLCFFLFVPAAAQDLETLYTSTVPHVVEITTQDTKGQGVALGSGFFIAPDRIVTNFHVIDRGTEALCHLQNGDRISVDGVLGADEDLDIAILQLSRPMQGKGLTLAAIIPNPGAPIAVIGSPKGLSASLSNGIVAAVRDVEPFGTVIQMTAPISPGNSGGPVLNMAGEVVGISTFYRPDGNSLYFAVPATRIQSIKKGDVIPLATFNKERNANPGNIDYNNGKITEHVMPDFQITAGWIDRLRGNDKRELAEAAEHSMILPNGDIVALYRFFRTAELVYIERPLSRVEKHLEAIGDGGKTSFTRPDGSRISVTIEMLPPKIDYPRNAHELTRRVLLDLPLIGEDLPIVPQMRVEKGYICTMYNLTIVVMDTDDKFKNIFAAESNVVYFPIATLNVNNQTVLVYKPLNPFEHKPTLDQMAYHAERGGAAVILYDYKTVTSSGKTSRYVGTGSTTSRISKSTIEGVTHRWSYRTPDLRFMEAVETSDVATEPAPKPKTEAPAPSVTHTLKMRDGRTLNGRILEESRSGVRFMMVVGSIEQEMSLSKSEIESIEAK